MTYFQIGIPDALAHALAKRWPTRIDKQTAFLSGMIRIYTPFLIRKLQEPKRQGDGDGEKP